MEAATTAAGMIDAFLWGIALVGGITFGIFLIKRGKKKRDE